MLPIVCQEHALGADKKYATVPLGDFFVGPFRRLFRSLMPAHDHGAALASGWKFERGRHRSRRQFRVRGRARGAYCRGGVQVQSPKWKVVPVAAEVAHGAAAEVPPAIPLRARKIGAVEWSPWSRPDPEVPVEVGRWLLSLGWPLLNAHNIAVLFGVFGTLAAPGSAHPNAGSGHIANRSGLNQLHHAAIVRASMNLGTHLSGHACRFSGFHHLACFPDVRGQRLFAINVLFKLKGGQGGKGVGVF